MSIFKYLSLKGRFLIAPIIGVVLVAILIITSYQNNQSQVELFTSINDSNLPQISQISRISIQLSQNKLVLSKILDPLNSIDEETIYVKGREVLDDLLQIEQDLLQNVLHEKQLIIDDIDLSKGLTQAFYHYQESVISAIELSTVDPKLSQRELNNAEQALTDLNEVLLLISQHHIKQMKQASKDISSAINAVDETTILSIVALLIMILTAYYFANHLSKGLDSAVHALVSLSYGNTNISVEKSDDQYLEQLTAVVVQFKASLQENEQYKRELKANVAELSINEERFSSMLELSPTGLITINEKQEIILFNLAAENIFGYSSEEMLGQSISLLMPQRFHKKHLDHVNGYGSYDNNVIAMSPGNIVGLRKNGEEFYLEAHISKSVLFSGTLMNVSLVDLTQRHSIENELKRYFHIVANSNDMIAFIDDNYTYSLVNDKYLTTLNMTSEQIIGQHIRDVSGEGPFYQLIKSKLNKAYSGKEVAWQNWMETPTGKRFLNINYKPFFVDKKVIGITVTIQDFTELQHSQESLHKLQNYLSNIIDSMPSILIGVDEKGLITQWNKMVQNVTNISKEDALGKSLSKVFPRLTPEMTNIDKAIKTKRQQNNYKHSYFDNGETHYEDVMVYPLIANGVQGAVIRVDNVTEKVRLEEMMIQSEKMLSVGGLAAGMAHEINNPLAGMMQTANVMQNRLIDPELPANIKAADAAGIKMEGIQLYMESRGIVRMTNAIRESGLRVAEIVENMLSFSRKSESTVSSHNLTSLIEKTILLASTDYDLKKEYDFKTIQIEKNYDDILSSVPCEGAKIQQVLLNLFRNGAQAMQQDKDKKSTFTIRTYHNEERRMACIDIEDNGPGMDDAVRKRVFEPFFTTKPVGVGTGLGLSVSYFIITENHNGHLHVTSTPGEGSCFTLCLPYHPASKA